MSVVSEFSKFIGDRKILLVEPSQTIRISMKDFFGKIGVPRSNILTAKDYKESKQFFKEKIACVISDFEVEEKSGVELCQEIFHEKIDLRNTISIILTMNNLQSTVIEAAEGMIDAFIIKPFSKDKFLAYVDKIIQKKKNMEGYQSVIFLCRQLLLEKQYDELLKQTENLENYTPRQKAQLLTFRAESHLHKNKFDDAKVALEEALQIEKFNYRAYFLFFDLYLKMNDKKKAYSYLSAAHKLYPINPKRIAEYIKIAHEIENYEDIEKYYQFFLKLEDRRPELIQNLMEALIGCAHSMFLKNDNNSALQYLQKAISVSKRHPKCIWLCTLLCLWKDLKEEARMFFMKFNPTDQKSEEYLAIDFLLQAEPITQKSDAEKIFPLGMSLVDTKTKTLPVYRMMLKLCDLIEKPELKSQIETTAATKWKKEDLQKPIFEYSSKKISISVQAA